MSVRDDEAAGRTADQAGAADLESGRERRRTEARAVLGLIAGGEEPPPLRAAVGRSGVGWYPLGALGSLVLVAGFQDYAIGVLGPEITAGLGISRSALAGVIVLKTLVVTLAALGVAAFVQKRPRRALVAVAGAVAGGLFTLATGYTIAMWGLIAVLVATGATVGLAKAIHQPLLVDSYPPEVRLRGLAFYSGCENIGLIVGPSIVGICTAMLGMTWRGVFVCMGVVTILAALAASALRDPGYGKWDLERVRHIVHDDERGTANLRPEDVELGFFEVARRLLLIPTVKRVLTAWVVLGLLLVPFTTYLAFFLQERWGMGPGARSVFSASMPVFSIAALAVFSKRGEDQFRRDPSLFVARTGLILASAVTILAVGIFAPAFGVMVLLFGLGYALIGILGPRIAMMQFSIIPAHMRPHMAALSGIALAGVGGGGGLLLLGGIDRRFGTAGAIVSLAVPGIAAGLVLRSASRSVDTDLDNMIDDIVEEEEVRELGRRGVHLPMLACRNIDFSYGQLQVLFDVNFTVDDGAIVALLGTNGAGKSTLLRVIAGLGLPNRGSVRFRGRQITYVDAERRVGMGISQVPGGHAVFGSLTVVENMRVLAHTHGRNRRAIDEGIDASFEAFPRLAERRGQLASTLSGGEQQMLGLSTAFIVRPRLLLIDELSLGLAPKIVGELLDMVRRINRAGTAVVLVEQSVNVALSVVDHAYFMEKGQIRFDGRAADLLDRPDLLRSVFLEGASQGFGKPGKS